MLSVECTGSPYEIGLQHGSVAATQVHGSIAFYASYFKRQTGRNWAQVQEIAESFLPYLEKYWSDYIDEMRGIAAGAEVDFRSIVALNVRTEIGFGLLNDGCTAFSWKTDQASFIAQNWDWELAQAKNIIQARIVQKDKPRITMMTEAGIIGKIGLNSAGVGVTLNAIRAVGVDVNRLPTHLALRTVLNSESQHEARKLLTKHGVAAACHITIADFQSGGIGLECTSADIEELEMEGGMCTHSNHLVRAHIVKDLKMLADSPFRLSRVQHLLRNGVTSPDMQSLKGVLKDEANYPTSICRAQDGMDSLQTLFSIVMDLKEKTASVKIGRPTDDGEELELRP